MKKRLSLLFINFAIVSSLLVGLELSGQIAFYVMKGRFVFQDEQVLSQQQAFELHPYLVGRLKRDVVLQKQGKTIRATAQGTRWTGAPEQGDNLIRIAVLGGSTTFGTGVSDEESWPAQLQAKLGDGYKVINYGIPAFSTAEAIIQMALVVPESQPHVVVLLQGWNDIHNYHEPDLGVDYYAHGMRVYDNLVIPRAKLSTFDNFKNISAIARFIHILGLRFWPNMQEKNVQSAPDPFVDRIYVRNLSTLKALSQHMGAYALFVPQMLNDAHFLQHDGAYDWTRHIESRAMPALMKRFNGLMHQVCPARTQECDYVTAIAQQTWLESDFVDYGHFSQQGGDKFSSIIAADIRSKIQNGMIKNLQN